MNPLKFYRLEFEYGEVFSVLPSLRLGIVKAGFQTFGNVKTWAKLTEKYDKVKFSGNEAEF